MVYNSTEVPPLDRVEGTSKAVRSELGIPLDAKVVGVSAWLVPVKGHSYLLDAFPAVLDAVPGAWLVLAGDGPERPRLEEQARRLGIRRRVRFLGHRTDVKRIVQAYDVGEASGRALISVLEDPEVARRMGTAARERVLTCFNAGKMIRETMRMVLGESVDGQAPCDDAERMT